MNIYADLARHRPSFSVKSFPYPGESLSFSDSPLIEQVHSVMLELRSLELLEQRKYKLIFKTSKFETYINSVIQSKVKDSSARLGHLLLKWWSKLHFPYQQSPESPNKS